jgi:hypothetical protein
LQQGGCESLFSVQTQVQALPFTFCLALGLEIEVAFNFMPYNFGPTRKKHVSTSALELVP